MAWYRFRHPGLYKKVPWMHQQVKARKGATSTWHNGASQAKDIHVLLHSRKQTLSPCMQLFRQYNTEQIIAMRDINCWLMTSQWPPVLQMHRNSDKKNAWIFSLPLLSKTIGYLITIIVFHMVNSDDQIMCT